MKNKPSHYSDDVIMEFDNFDDAGNIVPGDWDKRINVRYTDFPKYKAVHQRYNEGVAWEDTELFEHLLDAIDVRGSFDDCQDVEDLRQRYEKIDSIYQSMQSDGLLPRSKLCKKTDIKCLLDVPKVNIGRNGEFIHQPGSGNHRVALASVLGIDVEVRVVVRHKKWQEIRDEIVNSKSKEDLTKRARQRLGHPDLVDIVPAGW